MAAELRLAPGATVLDVAAGTGKLTRMLTATGAKVIAVEPVEGMRRVLVSALPDVEVLEGTAEAMPVADGSVDAVTVAQAFHWFDAEHALAEIHRALRPGGSLGLIWNAFDTSLGWVAALQALVLVQRRGEPQYGRSGWRATMEASALYGPIAERTFGLIHELDTDGLVARIGSISYIATLPEAARGQLFDEVRALVSGLPRPLRLPYRTDTFITRRL